MLSIKHRWNKLNPKLQLFIYFILMFIFSLFLLSISDTGWRKGAYKCVQSLFLLMSLFVIFSGNISRVLLRVLLTWTVLSYAYYNYLYGKIDPGTILSILETNSNEAMEFYTTLDISIALKAISLACLFWFLSLVIQNKLKFISPKKYKFMLPLILSYGLFMAGKFVKPANEDNEELTKTITRTIWSDTTKFLEQDVYTHYLAAFSRYYLITTQYEKEIVSDWKNISLGNDTKDIYFFIIGESARKDAYGLYNPELNTTPELSELNNIIIVSDPISPAVQTRESVVRILSLNDEKQIYYGRNLIDLAKAGGLETHWISNQSKVGENDTLITSLAKRSDYYTFLNNGHYRKSQTDDHLLKVVEEAVHKKSIKPKLIILHTMGSHNSFCARIWKKVEIKTIHQDNQCYFNSIHNSYLLLEELMDIARKAGQSFKGIFLSDHGLVKYHKSPYYVHGAGNRYSDDAVKVPLVFFYDKDMTSTIPNQIINKRYFLRDFIHTFAQWVGLNGEKIDFSKSIISFEMLPQKNYILRSDFKEAPIK